MSNTEHNIKLKHLVANTYENAEEKAAVYEQWKTVSMQEYVQKHLTMKNAKITRLKDSEVKKTMVKPFDFVGAVCHAFDQFVYNGEDGNAIVNMPEFVLVQMGGNHMLECMADPTQPKERGRPRKTGVLKRKRETSNTVGGNDHNNDDLQTVVANLQAQLLAIQQNMQNNTQKAGVA
eukprot:2464851-Rhodomonas_salina.1